MSQVASFGFRQGSTGRKRAFQVGSWTSIRSPVAVAAVVCLVSFATSVWADERYPQEFRDAIRAQDQKNWNKSIDLMRRALKKQSEDGQRVRIYGTRYKSYVPHYYLGLAFFRQHDCARALKEWDVYSSITTIRVAEEQNALQRYRNQCQGQGLLEPGQCDSFGRCMEVGLLLLCGESSFHLLPREGHEVVELHGLEPNRALCPHGGEPPPVGAEGQEGDRSAVASEIEQLPAALDVP